VRSRCELCGKGTAFGHNVSHSHRKTNRTWLPNIQKARVVRDGRSLRVQICTRCMRTERKRAAQ
jgi:large subunit ribosomal protein L28